MRHLPLLGIGPAYAGGIALMTSAAVYVNNRGILRAASFPVSRNIFFLTGGMLFICGIILWLFANFQSRIGDNIQKNRLVTTGIYSVVRNPICSAHLLVNTGVLLFTCNVYFLILPFIYWGYMTVLLKRTEEKWLRALYGQEYVEYCKKVNRCIPWFWKVKCPWSL